MECFRIVQAFSRPQNPRRRLLATIGRLSLPLIVLAVLAACGDGGSSSTPLPPPPSAPLPPPPGPGPQIKSACATPAYPPATFTYAETTEIAVPKTAPLDFGILDVTIPFDSVGIGIVLQGTGGNFKVIDHGIVVTDEFGSHFCITGPGGDAPLSFNQIDFDVPPDGIIEDDPSILLNRQAPALFFPNDGSQLTLPAGTYSFPIGAIDASFEFLESDTFQPYVFYKRATQTKTTLNVNLFVAVGVRAQITDAVAAQADVEIKGAIQVLRNVYQNALPTAPLPDIILNIRVATVSMTYVIIETLSEQDMLLRIFPGIQDHDAMNLFVVGNIAIPGIPVGVLGLSAGVPGPFNRQGTIVSGVLAEYQGDGDGTLLGFILAHELGHFLGLYHTSQTSLDQTAIIGHDPIADTLICTTAEVSVSIDNCPDRQNVMFPIAEANATPEVTADQGRVVRLNPGVSIPPPP